MLLHIRKCSSLINMLSSLINMLRTYRTEFMGENTDHLISLDLKALSI